MLAPCPCPGCRYVLREVVALCPPAELVYPCRWAH